MDKYYVTVTLGWHDSRNGDGVMCFTSGIHIKCLKVHSAPWFVIFLCTDGHLIASCNRVTYEGLDGGGVWYSLFIKI